MNCYHLEYLNQQEKENKREAKIKAKLAEIADDEESYKIKDHRKKTSKLPVFAISKIVNGRNLSASKTKRRLLFDENESENKSEECNSPIELKITKDITPSQSFNSKGRLIFVWTYDIFEDC